MTEEIKKEAPAADASANQAKPDPNNPANPANPSAPELTVTDLQALKTIIDVACSRGTFKAAEMTVVGNTYNRLEQFLNAVKPAEQKAGEAPATAEAPKA
tara:strand:+ start:244 stop:543 length:300 start_codon:yes stop_codon:yes gene_type:complete